MYIISFSISKKLKKSISSCWRSYQSLITRNTKNLSISERIQSATISWIQSFDKPERIIHLNHIPRLSTHSPIQFFCQPLNVNICLNKKLIHLISVWCCSPISVWVGTLRRPRWASKSTALEPFSYNSRYGIHASSGKTLHLKKKKFIYFYNIHFFPMNMSYLFISIYSLNAL